MKLGEFLLNYRKRYRLSLRSLAERVGCSYQYLSKLETGDIVRPSTKMLEKIAAGMGMTLPELIENADDIVVHLSSDEPTQSLYISREPMTEAYVEQHEEATENLMKTVREVTRYMPLDEIRHFIKIIEAIYPQYIREEDDSGA